MFRSRAGRLWAGVAAAMMLMFTSFAEAVAGVAFAIVKNADELIDVVVESIVAYGHSIKAMVEKTYTQLRASVQSIAANHVVMLRCKGPVSG
jgi:uncharacterized alkaline shock family protein YloU